MTDFDTYPRSGVWLERVRVGAELAIALGGVTLAALAAMEQLRELEYVRHDLVDHPLPPQGGGEDGAG